MKTMNTKNVLKASQFFILLFAFAITFTSCNSDDSVQNNAPTANAFNSIRQDALDNITQEFQINAANGTTTLTSANGVELDVDASCLTLNGNAITGIIDIEYVEVFDGGQMLVTDKTTMGKLPNGDMAMLVSGGAFYINATQNGQQLALGCNMNLRIPASLTAPDNNMTLWNGVMGADGNVDWEEEDNTTGQNGVFLEQGAAGGQGIYYAAFGNFGWTNVDRFYSYVGLKT